MPKPNYDLILEKVGNVKKDVDDLEKTVKAEYTPLSKTNEIDKRVTKFEGFWDWGIKLVLGALIIGILALLGLGAK